MLFSFYVFFFFFLIWNFEVFFKFKFWYSRISDWFFVICLHLDRHLNEQKYMTICYWEILALNPTNINKGHQKGKINWLKSLISLIPLKNQTFEWIEELFEIDFNYLKLHVMRCAIWYHLYNFKNVKNTHGGVLILVACNFTKINTSSWVFFRFLIVQMLPNRATHHIY